MLRRAQPEDHPVPSLQVQGNQEKAPETPLLIVGVIYMGVEPNNNNEGIGIEFFI